MVDRMTHWERVRASLTGSAVDRPPVSIWRDLYGQGTTAQGLADAMLGFQSHGSTHTAGYSRLELSRPDRRTHSRFDFLAAQWYGYIGTLLAIFQ